MTDLRPVGYIIGWLVVVLGVLMIPADALAGRLELLMLYVLLVPSFWKA